MNIRKNTLKPETTHLYMNTHTSDAQTQPDKVSSYVSIDCEIAQIGFAIINLSNGNISILKKFLHF